MAVPEQHPLSGYVKVTPSPGQPPLRCRLLNDRRIADALVLQSEVVQVASGVCDDQLGIRQARVRWHASQTESVVAVKETAIARIEVARDEMLKAFDVKEAIVAAGKKLGFAYVTTIPFSTRAVRAVTEYVAGGRTTENTPFGSEARRAVPGPSNVRSAETRTPPLNVVTPETTNAGTRARSRVSSGPCATTRLPRNAETDPEAIAWTLYVPGWRPTEYVPSEAAIIEAWISSNASTSSRTASRS